MLAAVLLVNEAGSYIARPLVDMSKEKIAEVAEGFLDAKMQDKTQETSIIETKIGNFFFQEIDDVYAVVLADKTETKILEGLKMVEIASKALMTRLDIGDESGDLLSIINVIDEIFTSEGVVSRTAEEITKIVTLQSNDEILHQMILKNKEKEKQKAEKMRKMHPAIDEIAKEIEELKILRKDLKSPTIPPHNPAKALKSEIKKGKNIIDTLENKINLVSHMKYTSTINSTTEITKTEGVGELLIKITDEEYGNIRINMKNKIKNSRAHPSVDKKLFQQAAISPKTDIPINTSLILMKWTVDSSSVPLEVSFWQNEISEERYKFFIEVTSLEVDIKYIGIKIPIKRISDIDIKNGKIQNDSIISEIHNLEKNESTAVEFSGLCDNTDSLFPFYVYYMIEEKETINPIEVSEIYTGEGAESPVNQKEITLVRVIEGECTVINSQNQT